MPPFWKVGIGPVGSQSRKAGFFARPDPHLPAGEEHFLEALGRPHPVDGNRHGDPYNPTPVTPDPSLLIRLSALGDLCFDLAALDVLERDRPGLQLVWAVQEGPSDLLRLHPHAPEILLFPRHHADALPRFLTELRKRRFAAAVDLQGNWKSSLVLAATRADRHWAPSRSVVRESRWLPFSRSPAPAGLHRTDRARAGAVSLGAYPAPVPPRRLRVPPGEPVPIGGDPSVCLWPGTSARGTDKRWSDESWRGLAAALAAEGAGVVWGTGPGDPGLPAAGHRAEVEDVGDLLRLIEAVDAFVSPDTGPLHLAARQGITALGLYSATDPAVHGPVGRRAHWIDARRSAQRPPRRRTGPPDPAMLSLDPSAVALHLLGLVRGESLEAGDLAAPER